MRVIRCRIEDLQVGDVVNRDPDAELGWFQIAGTSVLFDGKLQVSDKSEQLTISGLNHDIVGLQLVEEVEVDAHGRIVTAAPVAAAPAPAPVPQAALAPAPVPQAAPAPQPAPAADAPQPAPAAPQAAAASQPAPQPAPQPTAQPAPTPEPVEEADEPSDGDVPDFSATAGAVDLGKVLNLLEGLDAPEPAAPIRIELADGPPGSTPAPAPTAPASTPSSDRAEPPKRLTADDVTATNARPVYGDAMPDAPSYKNPVVIDDEATRPLPKRRSAA